MLGKDVWHFGQIGNGACKLHYACAGTGGKSHPLDYAFQQDLAFIA